MNISACLSYFKGCIALCCHIAGHRNRTCSCFSFHIPLFCFHITTERNITISRIGSEIIPCRCTAGHCNRTAAAGESNIFMCLNRPINQNISGTGFSAYIAVRCRHIPLETNCTRFCLCGNILCSRNIACDCNIAVSAGNRHVFPGCHISGYTDASITAQCNIPTGIDSSNHTDYSGSTAQRNIISGNNGSGVFSYRNITCLGFSIYIAVLRRHIPIEVNCTRFGLCGNILCSLDIAGDNNLTVSAGNHHVFPGCHVSGYIDASVTAQCNVLSGTDCPGHLNRSCTGCSGYISCCRRYCSIHCNCTIAGSKGCVILCCHITAERNVPFFCICNKIISRSRIACHCDIAAVPADENDICPSLYKAVS